MIYFLGFRSDTMNVKDAIIKTQSIRRYLDKDVSDEIINDLLEMARISASGNNAQPWRFKVVKDAETKKLLEENNIFKQKFVTQAPVIIFCFADPSAYPDAKMIPRVDDNGKLRSYRDVSIASQNLILRATELGLGSCYVGWLDKEKIKDVLNVPKEFVIPYAITLGYADGEFPKTPRRAMKEIVL